MTLRLRVEKGGFNRFNIYWGACPHKALKAGAKNFILILKLTANAGSEECFVFCWSKLRDLLQYFAQSEKTSRIVSTLKFGVQTNFYG